MLQLAHDTLTNQSSRTEYDRALSEDRDATLTMDVAWDKVSDCSPTNRQTVQSIF
jgi:hypothetical protein